MIQGYAEVLQAGIVQDREGYLDIILRRSRYMNQLLLKLMEIAQLDTHKERMRLITTNISELLRRVAADYVPVLEKRSITFDVRIPEQPIKARVDQQLIERAVRNLIDNAIQYGGSGGYVGLTLDVRDGMIDIHICDHGPGIKPEQQELIFQRFYRGSKGRNGEGLGIGLSIVQEIAAAHEGQVVMKSISHEETTFTLTLRQEK